MKTFYINTQNGPNFKAPIGPTPDVTMYGDTRFGPKLPSDMAYTNIIMGLDPAGRGYPTTMAYKYEADKYAQCQSAIRAVGTQPQGMFYDSNRVLYDPSDETYRAFMEREAARLAPWPWIMLDNITPRPIGSGTFRPLQPVYTDLVYYESLMLGVSEFITGLRRAGSKARIILNISKPWTTPEFPQWRDAIEFLFSEWTLLGADGFMFEYPEATDITGTCAWIRLGLRTLDDLRPLFLITKSARSGTDKARLVLEQLDSVTTYRYNEP